MPTSIKLTQAEKDLLARQRVEREQMRWVEGMLAEEILITHRPTVLRDVNEDEPTPRCRVCEDPADECAYVRWALKHRQAAVSVAASNTRANGHNPTEEPEN